MPGLLFEEQAPIAPSAPNRMDIALMVGFVPLRRVVTLPRVVSQWLKERGWSEKIFASWIPPVEPTAALSVSDVGPNNLVAESEERIVTVFGKGFKPNLTVQVTAPGAAVSIPLDGNQLRNVTADSFQMAITLDTLGSYKIQIKNPDDPPPALPSPPVSFTFSVLLDVPIPIESWAQFDQLFAWEQRTSSGREGSTNLGAAVRSFFAQGGRRCYVVRAGDPAPLEALRAPRLESLRFLIPGYPFHFDPSPADRESWHGLGHLFGLPDVSFVCLPDLPEVVSVDRTRMPLPAPPVEPREVFAECSVELPAPPKDITVRDIGAPRCDDAGYADWAAAVNMVTGTLARRNRESEFVAAVPLPEKAINFDGLRSTAFLQLVYPWVRTPGSISLAENLEPPDGALTGILARNALVRGTYQTAASFDVGDIAGLSPQLSREEEDRMETNICLVGPTPRGLRLLSDVTMSEAEAFRPGSVSRLIATVVRTARRIGEDITFEPSGENAWATVRERLNAFLLGLFHAGALRGSSPEEAYDVRCDRGTMTQNDLDAGRLIAIVQLDPAAPIDTITVVLVMNEDRQLLAPVSEAA